MKDKIKHKGIIEQIDGDHITVRIVQSSACSSCQAKNLCASSECKEKRIDLYDSNSGLYKEGEEVNVCASMSMGRNAVILAFAVPLVTILLWALVSISLIKLSEVESAIGCLIILTLYYTILSFNKKRISDSFFFWIDK